MSSERMKRKNSGGWLLGVVISIVLILIFIVIIDWQEFSRTLTAIQPQIILVMVFLTILALLTRSLAWRSLLDNEVRYRDVFFAENIGYLVNNFLPLRLGEIARGVMLAENVTGGFPAVLPSIILERLIDMGFALITLLIAIPFVVSESWMLPAVVFSICVISAGGIFIVLTAHKTTMVEKWIAGVFANFPTVKELILRLFHQYVTGLKAATQKKNAIFALFFLALTWIFYWLSYHVLIRSFVPESEFVWALFTDGIVSMGIAIPSAPGSLGVWEASFVAALSFFDVGQSTSLAIALVMHLISYAVTGFFGIIGFAVFGSSLGRLIQKIREVRSRETV